MSAAGAVAAGRSAAESLMVDACTIARPGVRGDLDPATLRYGTAAGGAVYTGKCRVKPRDNQDHVVNAGEQPVSLWPFIVAVPIDVVDVQVDDLVTITASSLDADLVGNVMRVRQVTRGSHITARRLGCEVNAG